jgi:preprotein translocase subunit SecA
VSVFGKLLRAGEGKKVRSLASIVPLINAQEEEIEKLDDAALAHKTVEFRERLDRDEDLSDLLVEGFAVVREAAWRTIGQRHFDVQLMGGMALHFGWIAEMKTGEGKTLVSTLPVYLNGLTGRGLHVVTVNDYLARRDAEWMGQIYRFLGLTVGLVTPDVDDPVAKRAAYAADVTYGTNTEFGFDYLRDNMTRSRDQMVQREHIFAIIDEVDSILIDEARTPLIISGPSDDSTRLYYQFASIVRTLRRDEDYETDEEKRTVLPTETGIAKVERQLGVENMYDSVSVNYVHQLEKALQAKELYHRDKDYLVADGQVKIVDEFTGRVLEGRRWSDGLHQAVEAKERVKIQEENHTWATVTLQNYFRMYEKLAGMTGTAETEASEFASTYGLQVVPIPTNMPMIRADNPDFIYRSEDAKFRAVVDDISERYETGQPVLVGTASVAKSEHLSALLEKQGIPHHVLNAKQHAREATIVAQAGRLHAVTVATNMAGRGVDIILGGNPEGLAREEVLGEDLDIGSDEGKDRFEKLVAKYSAECEAEGEEVRGLGGLYVLGSERHESRRIDNQLRGRSGRQGDPGESRFFLSLEDELMRLFATGLMNWAMGRQEDDDIPIEMRMVTRAIEKAQHTVEARNAEIRKDVLKYDEVMNEQRKVIYKHRMQIIDGEDLKDRTETLLAEAVERVVRTCCPSEFPEDWDLERLVAETSLYYPTQFTVEELEEATSRSVLIDSLQHEALDFYAKREQELPGGEEMARDIERQVMLQIVDQRWRDHLAEMDYLREGIGLRGLAQQDPLVAWQREGYAMFDQLVAGIDDDYLRYVTHVQVLTEAPTEPDFSEASYVAADDPVSSDGLAALSAVDDPEAAEMRAASSGVPPAAGRASASATGNGRGADRAGARAGGGSGRAVAGGAAASGANRGGASRPAGPARGGAGAGGGGGGGGGGQAGRGQPQAGLAGAAQKSQKIGRNDPCWCGSGKKYKMCHGLN